MVLDHCQSFDFNWEQFANLEIINFDAAALDQSADVAISTYLSDGDYGLPGENKASFLATTYINKVTT